MTEIAKKEPGQEPKMPFWGSFSQADIRLLVITFAGTVAANVVTVLVVAVAIIAVRSSANPRPTLSAVLALLVSLVAFAVIVVASTVAAIRQNRHPGGMYTRVFMVVMVGLTVLLALGALFFLLVLIGYAVGVK